MAYESILQLRGQSTHYRVPDLDLLTDVDAYVGKQISASAASDSRAGLEHRRWVRTRAMLLLGFWTGRNSEQIASLKVDDVQTVDDLGLSLHGENLSCPSLQRLCPVKAYFDWVHLMGIQAGPVFPRFWPNGHLTGRPIHPTAVSASITALVDMFQQHLVADRPIIDNYLEWCGKGGWLCHRSNRRDKLAALVGLAPFDPAAGDGHSRVTRKMLASRTDREAATSTADQAPGMPSPS